MPPTQISHQPILLPCKVDNTLLGVLLIDKIAAIKNSLRTDKYSEYFLQRNIIIDYLLTCYTATRQIYCSTS